MKDISAALHLVKEKYPKKIISIMGFLVVFSSMVFFLTKYIEKKVNNIIQISETEQIKFLKL